MKRFFIRLAGYACIVLSSCITEYEAKGLKEAKDILVVEGIITEGESIITLSRSVNLTDANPVAYVNDALVLVECDDGTRIFADPVYRRDGRYTLRIDNLKFDRKYRLKIEVEEEDCSANTLPCPIRKFEYSTDYISPIVTPTIDSVFWSKKDKGQPVNIHVATHSTDSELLYYRWSYREDWEIMSDEMSLDDFIYPFYCWNWTISRNLLIGSAEKTIFGQLTNIILEIMPSDRRLAVLYRINVKQNAISKQAYDYYYNIKKNTRQTASIFAPIQSELKGNITCVTSPDKPVIGYVDFSSTTYDQLYIPRAALAYEYPGRSWSCDEVLQDSLLAWYGDIPESYVPYYKSFDESGKEVLNYIYSRCIDCTFFGTTIKPDDWPNDHY